MSAGLRKLLFVAIAVALVGLPATPARGQSDEIDRVVPDPYFVKAECDRLSRPQTPSFELAQAAATVRDACAAYANDHDGDAWFKASDTARATLDGYERDHTQHAFRVVRPRELVPQDAKVYALFLAPSSTAWATADLADLRSKFEDLGDAIGAENLALWLEQPADPGKIDTARCRYYFDLFKLGARGKDVHGGPYIVTTSTRPDRWSSANDEVVVDLGGASIAQAAEILARLGAEIRTRSAVRGATLAQLAARYQTAIGKDPAHFRAVSVALIRGT